MHDIIIMHMVKIYLTKLLKIIHIHMMLITNPYHAGHNIKTSPIIVSNRNIDIYLSFYIHVQITVNKSYSILLYSRFTVKLKTSVHVCIFTYTLMMMELSV